MVIPRVSVQTEVNADSSGVHYVRHGVSGDLIAEFPFRGPGRERSTEHLKASMYAQGYADGQAAMAAMF